MKSERRVTRSSAKRRMQRRRQNMKRFMNGVAGVVLVLVVCFGFGNHFSGVEKVEAAVESSVPCSENAATSVLYKAVEIQRGETLWTIAENNMDGRYDTVAAYVDELQLINNLSDHDADMLQAGDYLTISYLADQA